MSPLSAFVVKRCVTTSLDSCKRGQTLLYFYWDKKITPSLYVIKMTGIFNSKLLVKRKYVFANYFWIITEIFNSKLRVVIVVSST